MKLALFGAGVALVAMGASAATSYFWPGSGMLGAWGIPVVAGAVAGIVIHHL